MSGYLRSSVPGVVAPAIPSAHESMVASLLWQLDRSQWWPAQTHFEQQLRQLEPLIAHAYATVPFYRTRLPLAALERPLTAEGWAMVPVLTREDVQAAGDALRSRATPPAHGTVGTTTSSGSTGRPVTAFGTAVSQIFFQAMNLRQYDWHRFDPAGVFASIRSMDEGEGMPPEGRRGVPWSIVDGGARGIALNCKTTTAEQLAWLERERPAYLLTYPSILVEIAHTARTSGHDLGFLRGLASFGEPLDPHVRELWQQGFGVAITDGYSAMECGAIAADCPEQHRLHAMCESTLVELLDDEQRPCPPGESGAVVITTLHNFAMPLIRYEIGDYARAGTPCPCGRGLPVLERVLGRTRNLLRLPDGSRRWPASNLYTIAAAAGARQIQLAQCALDEIEVRLAGGPRLSPDAQARITADLGTNVGPGYRFRFVYLDAIARGRGGKYEDFLCEIE